MPIDLRLLGSASAAFQFITIRDHCLSYRLKPLARRVLNSTVKEVHCALLCVSVYVHIQLTLAYQTVLSNQFGNALRTHRLFLSKNVLFLQPEICQLNPALIIIYLL